MLKPIQKLTFLFLIPLLSAKACRNTRISKPTVVPSELVDKKDEKSEEEHKLLAHTGAEKGEQSIISTPALPIPSGLKTKQPKVALQTAIMPTIKETKTAQDKQKVHPTISSQLLSDDNTKGNATNNKEKNDGNNKPKDDGENDGNKATDNGKNDGGNKENNNGKNNESNKKKNDENNHVSTSQAQSPAPKSKSLAKSFVDLFRGKKNKPITRLSTFHYFTL